MGPFRIFYIAKIKEPLCFPMKFSYRTPDVDLDAYSIF